MMKLYPKLLALAAVLSLVCSCSKPVEQEATLSVEVTSLSFDPAGGSKTISINATGAWHATASEDWITISPDAGEGFPSPQTITVTVAENKVASTRTGRARFTLNKGYITQDVAIAQTAETAISISDFVAKKTGNTWYLVQGTITSIEGYEKGEFYVSDGKEEILVYGMTEKQATENDKSFAGLGLKESDILTFMAVRSEYRGKAQAGTTSSPAYYISHKSGPALPAVYKDYKADAAAAGWMELPATSSSDDWTFLHHGMKIGSKPFRNYSVEWNAKDLVPMWVAYPLTRESIGYGTRTDAWELDPLLKESEQPDLRTRSYAPTSSYDRGHQLPSASRLSFDANKKTFYGTNMAPQRNDFNAGIWEKLESEVRSWAKSSSTDTLYVVTGCTLEGSTVVVSDNKDKIVTVPTGFYKALLRLSGDQYEAVAIFLEHTSYPDFSAKDYKKTDLFQYAMSIDALEEKIGIDLFVNLPADLSDFVESHTPSKSDWWWN